MRWIVFVLAACGSPSSGPKLMNTGHTGPVTPAKLLGSEDFAAAGKTLTKISDSETLVCAPSALGAPGANETAEQRQVRELGEVSSCFCLKQLDCKSDDCFTLQSNLDGFRAALARDTETVLCELADTGKFCDLSYFRFEGDIYRFEVRYFGADGRLLGQSNATDYPEYCEGRAMRQFTGRVPDCKMQPRDVEVICADPRYRDQAGKLTNPRAWID